MVLHVSLWTAQTLLLAWARLLTGSRGHFGTGHAKVFESIFSSTSGKSHFLTAD